MANELDEVRKAWEGDSPNVVAERIPRPAQGGWRENVLVVLKNKDNTYQCHRYFQTGSPDEWVVSVDGDRVESAETVMKWLCNPSARTCRPSEDDEE